MTNVQSLVRLCTHVRGNLFEELSRAYCAFCEIDALQTGSTKLHKTKLHSLVSRGPNLGELLFPHKHEDGFYVVSKTRFEKDYVLVATEAEILPWLEKGYGLRMSNPDKGITGPSLMSPKSIFRPVILK
jgi:hypothetical protein